MNNHFRFTKLLLVCCLLLAVPDSFSSDQSPLSLAESHFEEGELQKAISSAEKVTEEHPDFAKAQSIIANSYLDLGEPSRAATHFSKAAKSNPKDYRLLNQFLGVLETTGDTKEQARVSGLLFDLNPSDLMTGLKHLKALETIKQTRSDRYVKVLETLHIISPNNTTFSNKLLKLYPSRKQAAAKEARLLKLVLKKDKENSSRWARLGELLATTDSKGASAAFEKASLYSERVSERKLYRKKASAAAKGNLRAPKAKKANKTAVTKKKQPPKTKRKVVIEKKVEKPATTKATLSKSDLHSLAKKEHKAKNYAVAVQLFKQSGLYRNKKSDWFSYAEALTKSGQKTEAIEEYEAMAGKYRKDTTPLKMLASWYRKNGPKQKLIKVLSALTRLEKKNSDAKLELARLQRDSFKQARREYKAYLKLKPKDAVVWDEFGDLLAPKKVSEAIAAYETASLYAANKLSRGRYLKKAEALSPKKKPARAPQPKKAAKQEPRKAVPAKVKTPIKISEPKPTKKEKVVPKKPEDPLNLALEAYGKKNYSEAASLFEKSKRYKKQKQTWKKFCIALKETKRIEESTKQLQRYLKKYRNDVEAWEMLVDNFRQQGSNKSLIKAMRKLAQHNATDTKTRLELARKLKQNRKLSARYYKEYLNLRPKDAAVWNEYGDLLAEKKPKEAIAAYEVASLNANDYRKRETYRKKAYALDPANKARVAQKKNTEEKKPKEKELPTRVTSTDRQKKSTSEDKQQDISPLPASPTPVPVPVPAIAPTAEAPSHTEKKKTEPPAAERIPQTPKPGLETKPKKEVIPKPPTKQQLHQQALAAYEESRYEEALELFERSKIFGKNKDDWKKYNKSLKATGNIKLAVKQYEKFLKKHREDIETLELLADHYRNKKDNKRLKPKLKTLQRLRPKDPAILLEIASLEKAGSKAQIECLSQYLELKPEDTKRKKELASTFLKKKRRSEAFALYLQMVREIKDAPLLEQMAEFFLKNEQTTQAMKSYEQLLGLKPNHTTANYRLGQWFADKKQCVQAVSLLSRVPESRMDKSSWVKKGDCQLKQHNQREAFNSYENAFRKDPKDLNIAVKKMKLAQNLRLERRIEKAYVHVVELDSGALEAVSGLSMIRYRQKRFDEAAALMTRLKDRNGRNGSFWARYGTALLESKQITEASVAFQTALDVGYRSEEIAYSLVAIQIEQGKLDDAGKHLENLIRKNPGNHRAEFWLGKVCHKRTQTGVAEEHYKKALTLSPGNVEYARELATLYYENDDFEAAVRTFEPVAGQLGPKGLGIYAECLGRTGKTQESMQQFKKLFQMKPSAEALALSTSMETDLGRPLSAVQKIEKSEFKGNPKVKVSLARAKLTLGLYKEAYALARPVWKKDKGNVKLLFLIGRIEYGLRRFSAAENLFEQVLAREPDHMGSVYHTGLCKLAQKDREAQSYFKELSQHSKPEWRAKGNLGLALYFEQQGKPEAAENYLTKSATHNGKAEFLALISQISLRLKKANQAETWAKRAVQLNADYPAGITALSGALMTQKRTREALQTVQAGLKRNPENCHLLVESARINLEMGKVSQTSVLNNKAIQNCPDEPMPHLIAGMVAYKSNNQKSAKKHFKVYRKKGGDKELLPDM